MSCYPCSVHFMPMVCIELSVGSNGCHHQYSTGTKICKVSNFQTIIRDIIFLQTILFCNNTFKLKFAASTSVQITIDLSFKL